MEDQSEFYRYLAWKTPDEMHFSCMQWISYLNFMRDEHRFFEDLLTEYTLPLLETHRFDTARDLVNDLSISEKAGQELAGKLTAHRNNLKILLDGKDQFKEEQEYSTEHAALKMEVSRYTEKYRKLKKEIFEIISSTMKKQKQNRLLP